MDSVRKKRGRRYISLKRKLTVCIISVLAVFLALIYGVWFMKLKTDTENTFRSSRLTLVQGQNKLLSDILSETEKLILQTAVYAQGTEAINIKMYLESDRYSAADIYRYRRASSSYLVSCCSYIKNLRGLTIGNRAGNVLTYGVTYPFVTMLEEDWFSFQPYREGDKFILINPYYQDNAEHPTSHVFAIIHYQDGRTEDLSEIRVAEMNCSAFDSVYSLDTSVPLILIDEEGEILYSNRIDENAASLLERHAKEAAEHILGKPDQNTFQTSGRDDAGMFVYDQVPGTGWWAISVIPSETVWKGIIDSGVRVLWIMLLIYAGLMISVILIVDHYTKNITVLTKEIENITGETLKLSTEINSADEVQQLYVAFNDMLQRIQDMIQTVKETEEKKKQSELDALQRQINPHFIYNTLNTVRYLSRLSGTDNITKVMDSFLDLMHVILGREDYITAAQECQYLEDYIEIQSYQYLEPICFSVMAEEETKEALLPKLMIQPLVENALKHGISGDLTNGRIEVLFSKKGERLHIEVWDNGTGMDPGTVRKLLENDDPDRRHIGVQNVAERLRLIYGEDSLFEIRSTVNDSTRQIIEIPFKKGTMADV